MQDEILTRLAKVADLKVISRTSTQHFKSSPDNLPQIARQLGVAHILEGSVQKATTRCGSMSSSSSRDRRASLGRHIRSKIDRYFFGRKRDRKSHSRYPAGEAIRLRKDGDREGAHGG